MGGNPDRLVLIGVACDEVEANIWRDVLEKDGVRVMVRSANPLSPFGVAPPPGSLQVYVRAADDQRARWLLGEISNGSAQSGA